MKIKKSALALVVSLALVGCSQTPSTETAKPVEKVKTIGVANLGVKYPFPAAIGAGIKEAAEAKGYKVIELDADGKADKQASNIQDLINQNVTGVLILPVDSGVATGLVDQLKAKKIPTVAVASQVGDPKTRKIEDVYPGLVALVTQAEVKSGAAAGVLALEAIPQGGKVAIIEGSAGFAENQTRVADFTKAADAAGVKFEIVATQPGDWVADTAQSACQNILASNPDVSLFYNLSDDMSVGCAKAVIAAGSKAKIIGIGGSKLGIDSINSGETFGTVCYKPKDLGALAFKTLEDALTSGSDPANKFVTYETKGITKANSADCTPQW